ncbi:MAG: NUDIX hydrolase [Anaerolineaceae bacterium]
MPRAGIILIQDHKIALIERHRAGDHYFVVPGGQTEAGETQSDAAIREALEELGLHIRIEKFIATVLYQQEIQYYFLVSMLSGIFGQGKGPEMLGQYPAKNGTYQAVWVPIDDLPKIRAIPEPLTDLIYQNRGQHWPESPVDLFEVSK